MRKLISIILAVAMLSALFVVNVAAAGKSITFETVVTEITKEEFEEENDTLEDGYTPYSIKLFLTDYGTLEASGKKLNGRRLNNITYNISFSDISKVDTNTFWNITPTSVIGKINAQPALDVDTYKFVFAGDATTSLPAAAAVTATYNAENTDTKLLILDYYVAIQTGAAVTMDVSGVAGAATFTSGVPSGQENYDNIDDAIVFSPASYNFGAIVDPTPTPVYTDSSIDVKKPVSGTTGLTDLQGDEVTLTANYGIAKFSKAIDTVANNYFVVATDSNDVEQEFSVDFAAKGVEISNASTTFFAIVKSADHIIKNIRLKEVAKQEAD